MTYRCIQSDRGLENKRSSDRVMMDGNPLIILSTTIKYWMPMHYDSIEDAIITVLKMGKTKHPVIYSHSYS